MDSQTQELLSNSAFFPRKVKVTDALAFSTAKIPAVDRINLLNLCVNNKKKRDFPSIFCNAHLLLPFLDDTDALPETHLLYLETIENSLKLTVFGQSVSSV